MSGKRFPTHHLWCIEAWVAKFRMMFERAALKKAYLKGTYMLNTLLQIIEE